MIPEVTDLELAFGTTKDLPPWEELPLEFRNMSNTYCQLAMHLFYKGGEGVEIAMKDGVDPKLLRRWFHAHACSFEPKHEHKIGGIGFRFSQWLNGWALSENKTEAHA